MRKLGYHDPRPAAVGLLSSKEIFLRLYRQAYRIGTDAGVDAAKAEKKAAKTLANIINLYFIRPHDSRAFGRHHYT